MKIENFTAGTLRQQYKYKSFSPTAINREWTWDDPVINTLLERAAGAVHELNAFSLFVPEIDLFIQMHVVKEASTSSRIEGTQTNMEDAVKDIEDVDPEKRDDWGEVQNYIHAMNRAVAELQILPLSNRLLKQAHHDLMQGVRGQHKTPGDFRRSQNWIGASLDSAVFIPPWHEEVDDLMTDLEKFLQNTSINVPLLIRIALAHYQFETIHPFLDGNGRIGRLLITLFMVSQGTLNRPCLYLSDYLERKKSDYYDALTLVRATNNLAHWLRFFLTAVIETATKGVTVFKKIIALKERHDTALLTLGRRSPPAARLMKKLYERPFISVAQIAAFLEITPQGAYNIVHDFTRLGILREITGYKRNKRYVFGEYLALFMDGEKG